MAATAKHDTRFDTLDELVRHHMERLQVPGATVGILHDGQVETHGYGVISLYTNYPTRPDTLFQIGSNTKVFTATMVMKLVEEGTLDLDTPIKQYIPELRLADEQALEKITLGHLLSHMSGLEGDRFEDTGIGDDALAKYVDQAYTWAQETDPGELWSYCNSGFGLTGRVIEKVTGAVYENVMRERVFQSLGLEKTFWFAHEAIVWSAAAGHTQNPGQEAPQVALPYAIPRASNPAGAIISCVEDLLKFVQFHMGDGSAGDTQFLSADTLRAMREPRATITDDRKWGIGWSLRYINGVTVVQHGGGTNGHITQMLCIPEKDFGLAVLTNSSRGGGLIEKVEEWAFERYCGLTVGKPTPVELPREQLERLAGVYKRPMGTLTITVEDGHLVLAPVYKNPFSGEDMAFPPIKAAPTGEWGIVGIEGDFEGDEAQFIPNADGSAARFIRFGGRLVPKVS